MKTILISQDFVPLVGGISRYLVNLCKNYFGNEVTTITDKKHPYQSSIKGIKSGLDVKFQPFNSFEDKSRKKTSEEIIEFIDKEKPDLVIFGYVRSHVEVVTYLKQKNIKCGFIGHAKELFFNARPSCEQITSHKGYSAEEEKQYLLTLNKFDFAITVSHFAKQLLINQGISIPIFVAPPLISSCKKKMTKERNKTTMLSVGRLIPRKGQKDLVNLLTDEFMEENNLSYLIVGNGPDLDTITELIKKKHLEQYIDIITEASDSELNQIYTRSDFFVLPTKFIQPNDVEGLGIVFLEAQAHGLPVIGGGEGGVPETMDMGKTGFVFESAEDLLNKIVLLCKEFNLRQRMSSLARGFIDAQFGKLNEDLISFLHK